MPQPTPEKEAKIYRGMRDLLIRAHCDAERGHECCGAITITAETITFNCKLCGDSRQIIGAENGPDPRSEEQA